MDPPDTCDLLAINNGNARVIRDLCEGAAGGNYADPICPWAEEVFLGIIYLMDVDLKRERGFMPVRTQGDSVNSSDVLTSTP